MKLNLSTKSLCSGITFVLIVVDLGTVLWLTACGIQELRSTTPFDTLGKMRSRLSMIILKTLYCKILIVNF